MDDPKEFASRLTKAMAARNMKQRDLVEKTLIPKSAINHYVSGRVIPKTDRMYLLSRALRIRPEYLLGSVNEMELPDDIKTAELEYSEFLKKFVSLNEENKHLVIDYTDYVYEKQNRT